VNLDPNCGWARGKADVLYVADTFEVMRRVNAFLARSKLGGPGRKFAVIARAAMK
jgi:hypothetical protein